MFILRKLHHGYDLLFWTRLQIYPMWLALCQAFGCLICLQEGRIFPSWKWTIFGMHMRVLATFGLQLGSIPNLIGFYQLVNTLILAQSSTVQHSLKCLCADTSPWFGISIKRLTIAERGCWQYFLKGIQYAHIGNNNCGQAPSVMANGTTVWFGNERKTEERVKVNRSSKNKQAKRVQNGTNWGCIGQS